MKENIEENKQQITESKKILALHGASDLMHHNLRLTLVRGLGRFVLGLGVITHLNIFISITALFLVEIIFVIIRLCLEVFTLRIGSLFIFFFLASRGLGTLHLMIVTRSGLVGFLELLEERSLKLTLLGTVGTAVIVKTIGLGLVRRVLGRCRVLGIPGE
jgi:hypothetical protein